MDDLTILLLVSPLIAGLLGFVGLVCYGLKKDPGAFTRIPYPPLPVRHGEEQ